jgi:hypothetical protein
VTVTPEQVTAVTGITVAARHGRCWTRHLAITGPGRPAAAAVMRGPGAAGRPPQHVEAVTRDLAGYDRLFKVIDGGAES